MLHSRMMRAAVLLVALFAPPTAPHARAQAQAVGRSEGVKSKALELIKASGAETVAVAFHDLETGAEILINEDKVFHAASTMKVPVMLEVFRQDAEGRLPLDAPVEVKNDFKSIADGSRFSVSAEDDSEATLYERIGKTATVRELVRLMITESSNLATNILIERVTPERVMELMREYGAKDIRVLRGVEDGKAYDQGLNNTTTARDLLIVMRRLAERRAVSPRASDEMAEILSAQKFNKGIPAGLPEGTRVAHKTGSIYKISHDAAVVYAPGRKPYVLVVLTRGFVEEKHAHRLMADISRAVYEGFVEGKGITAPAK